MPRKQLASVAQLFGELLLKELSEERLRELRQPEVESALLQLGIDLPAEGELDDIAAEYFDRFVNPQRGFPLVQSLYQEGYYEGNAAVAVRQVAAAAGLDYDLEDALGAARDHLGSELILWSRLVPRDEEAAVTFAQRHLRWAPPVLRRGLQSFEGRDTFLSQLIESTARLIDTITDNNVEE